MCLPFRIVGIIITIILGVRYEYAQLLCHIRIYFRVLFIRFVEKDVSKAAGATDWLTNYVVK